MDTNKFWLCLWQSVTAAAVLIVLAIVSSMSLTQYQIRQEVMAGIDPLSASCAHGMDSSGVSCAILAAKK